MVASEAVPFVKTGGLADMVTALSRSLARLGHLVTLVVPRYRGIDVSPAGAGPRHLVVGGHTFTIWFGERPLCPGATATFVECAELFDRDGVYGVGAHEYRDNAVRFGVLARAALDLAARAEAPPDVVHAHDWQGGLVPVYLKTLYADSPALGRRPAVFTIHNIAYQGLFPPDVLPALGLGWDLFSIEAMEFWGRISLLKGGINFADRLTTVSRGYAREIMTPDCGFGFDGIVAARRDVLVGVPNGIDVEAWNPATDPVLPQPFSAAALEGKQAARRELLAQYGLPAGEGDHRRPVVGFISRLVYQKGLDLVAQVADDLPRLDATFVVLGSGDVEYEAMWRTLAARHPDRIGVRIGYDERLAHLVEAGADMFLMPSRYEPSGLNQMYSMRYGTVPIVRATGGLDDTVEAYDPATGQGTGFKFSAYSRAALLDALRTALAVFARPAAWRRLQLAGMAKDFSWDGPAAAYVQEYRTAIRKKTLH